MDKIAFVFSGQGAQHPGMGLDLYEKYSSVKEIFDGAEKIRPGIKDVCFNGSAEDLKKTENTQPCVYLADTAAATALSETGVKPDALAGFSLGEIPALAFGKAFTVEEGFAHTCKRGELMAAASAKFQTAMLAVLKMDNGAVEEICRRYAHVYPVNYNCKGQLVVSGLKEELAEAKKEFESAGGRTIELAVSGAFHSPFMDEAAKAFGEYLSAQTINQPALEVYSDYTANPYTAQVKSLMENQINNPVLWEKLILNMRESGVRTFIETGVGNTLQKLIAKIAPDCRSLRVETAADIEAVAEEVL